METFVGIKGTVTFVEVNMRFTFVVPIYNISSTKWSSVLKVRGRKCAAANLLGITATEMKQGN